MASSKKGTRAGKRKPDADDPNPLYAVNRKAHKIRQLVAIGKAKPAHVQWLAEFDAKGAQAMADAADAADAIVDDATATPAELEQRAAEAAPEQPLVEPPAVPSPSARPAEPPAAPTLPTPHDAPPAPPTPPRAARKIVGALTKNTPVTGWRSRYGDSDSSGREKTAVYVASLWHGVLKQMSDSIRAAGIDPIVVVDTPECHVDGHDNSVCAACQLRRTLVLACDDILPPEFTLTPAVIAVGSSTALLAQRTFRRKEIAAAKAKAEQPAKRIEQVKAASTPKPPEPKLTVVPPTPPAPVVEPPRDPFIPPEAAGELSPEEQRELEELRRSTARPVAGQPAAMPDGSYG